MDKADKEFIENMVRELDASIEKLVKQEKSLMAKLGEERTEELSELWLEQLSAEEADELKRGLDYLDKKLIWTLKQGKQAKVAFLDGNTQKQITVEVSLAGFSNGFGALRAKR